MGLGLRVTSAQVFIQCRLPEATGWEEGRPGLAGLSSHC